MKLNAILIKTLYYATVITYVIIMSSFPGLTPNTTYRVSVCAKNIRAPQFIDQKAAAHTIDKLSASIEFRTLPKGMRDSFKFIYNI